MVGARPNLAHHWIEELIHAQTLALAKNMPKFLSVEMKDREVDLVLRQMPSDPEDNFEVIKLKGTPMPPLIAFRGRVKK